MPCAAAWCLAAPGYLHRDPFASFLHTDECAWDPRVARGACCFNAHTASGAQPSGQPQHLNARPPLPAFAWLLMVHCGRPRRGTRPLARRCRATSRSPVS
jgi:hypothetical protein